MTMIRILLILMVSFSVIAEKSTTRPIVPNGLIGDWVSSYVVVKGEKQKLVISQDNSTKFSRKSKDGKVIAVYSKPENMKILDDIVLIEYHDGEFGIRYKLVLSGWKLSGSGKSASAVYGMMFLYQNGVQFNGFPVSFRAKVDANS